MNTLLKDVVVLCTIQHEEKLLILYLVLLFSHALAPIY